jgi:hypothetical protein
MLYRELHFRPNRSYLLFFEYMTLQNISLHDIQRRLHLVTICRMSRFSGCGKPASYSRDHSLNIGYSVFGNSFVILAIPLFHGE